ncbi:hypothetical protein EDC01DRAFT_743068 [Geopyxis carbonaria]|nr:hypothetical protein EDC01DRAFT_743068 [Geopyxis carbonaria]
MDSPPQPAELDLLGWDREKEVFLYNSRLSPKSGAVTAVYAPSTADAALPTAFVFENTAVTPAIPITLAGSMTRMAFQVDLLLKDGALVTAPKTTAPSGNSPTTATATVTATGTTPAASTGPGIAAPGRYECARDDAGSLACRPAADVSTTGAIAAAGAMGGLLAAALVALVFVFMRQRRRSKQPPHPSDRTADRAGGASHSTLAGDANSYGGVGKVDDEDEFAGAGAGAGVPTELHA